LLNKDLEARKKELLYLKKLKDEQPQLYDPYDLTKVPTEEAIHSKYKHTCTEECAGKSHLDDLEAQESNNSFIFGDFLSPGTHSVIVYDPKTNELYYKLIAVDVRVHDHSSVDVKRPKAGKADTKEELAKLNRLLFNEYHGDTSAMINMSFRKDTDADLFKPYKYMTDFTQVEGCLTTIKKNFDVFKTCFVILAAESGQYPNIDEKHLTKFCARHLIIDDLCTLDDIKQIFIDTNFEYIDDTEDQNPDDLLNRSEFFEIWMRIAHCKYKTVMGKNVDKRDALEKELQDGELTLGPKELERIQQEIRELDLKKLQIKQPHEWLNQYVDNIMIPMYLEEDIAGFRQTNISNDINVLRVLMKNFMGLQKLYDQNLASYNITTSNAAKFSIQSAISMFRINCIYKD
jgi:hypothetical protein